MTDQKILDKEASSTSGDDTPRPEARESDAANRRRGGLGLRRGGGGGQPEVGRPGKARRALTGLGGDAAGTQLMRRRVVMRFYRMLMRTPDDGSGLVPGTPFPKAGVADVVAKLNQRAAAEGTPGARVAARAVEFLKPSDGEEVISGVSVDKLQTFARMADRFQAARQ